MKGRSLAVHKPNSVKWSGFRHAIRRPFIWDTYRYAPLATQIRCRGSRRNMEIRSCTEVRILPLHPRIAARFIPDCAGSLCLSARASLFAPLGVTRQALPVTYCFTKAIAHSREAGVRTFLPDKTQSKSCLIGAAVCTADNNIPRILSFDNASYSDSITHRNRSIYIAL